jgi:hypothetical protein
VVFLQYTQEEGTSFPLLLQVASSGSSRPWLAEAQAVMVGAQIPQQGASCSCLLQPHLECISSSISCGVALWCYRWEWKGPLAQHYLQLPPALDHVPRCRASPAGPAWQGLGVGLEEVCLRPALLAEPRNLVSWEGLWGLPTDPFLFHVPWLAECNL